MMKTMLRVFMILVLPCMMYGQSDLTISPDSVYFTTINPFPAVIDLTNSTNQPINLLHVQPQCDHCVGGWGWFVDSISVSTPHYIYPGQHVTIIMRYWAQIKDAMLTNFLRDSMFVVSSAGTQYCQIFFDPDLISATDEHSGSAFTVFPNPATSFVNIRVKGNLNGEEMVVIYNSSGDRIREIKPESKETVINMDWAPTGIYLFRFTDGKVSQMKKVVKTGD